MWHPAHGILDIRAIKRTGHDGLLLRLFINYRHHVCIAIVTLMLDEAHKHARREIRAESPGRVPVANDVAEIGQVCEHAVAPHVLRRNIDLVAINTHVYAAEKLQIEACGCDDDVGIDLVSTAQLYAIRVNGLDCVRHNMCSARVEGLEVVAVWTQTHALLPGVVAGFEVWVDGEVGRELGDSFLDEERGGHGWEPNAELVEKHWYEEEHEACTVC